MAEQSNDPAHDPTPPRRLEWMRLDEIPGADRNPKNHDIVGIKRSIRHHGVAAPLLLNESTGQLVGGHGTLAAVASLRNGGPPENLKEGESWPPDGIEVDADGMWRYPVFRGLAARSPDDAEALLVALNRLSQKGGWHDRELADLLGDLEEVGMLELTGYSSDDLDALIGSLDTTPAPSDGGAPGSADMLDPPEGDKYRSQYGVIVECGDAVEQEATYDNLRELGYVCRVVTV